MKITVLGTGAMGSIYAALLADAGHEVWAVDLWREHVEAIRTTGLRNDTIVATIKAREQDFLA